MVSSLVGVLNLIFNYRPGYIVGFPDAVITVIRARGKRRRLEEDPDRCSQGSTQVGLHRNSRFLERVRFGRFGSVAYSFLVPRISGM